MVGAKVCRCGEVVAGRQSMVVSTNKTIGATGVRPSRRRSDNKLSDFFSDLAISVVIRRSERASNSPRSLDNCAGEGE